MYHHCLKIAPKEPNTRLFAGLNKGHVVTKKELAPRPSDMKGVSNLLYIFFIKDRNLIFISQPSFIYWFLLKKTSKRVHFVMDLIREVARFTPCEKRITELLKVGKDKRALKVTK
ncbi:putative ribosomal protein L36e [Helianthus annuus]|nr:putative ribosomal protein L36e [Helianthus annuus]